MTNKKHYTREEEIEIMADDMKNGRCIQPVTAPSSELLDKMEMISDYVDMGMEWDEAVRFAEERIKK